MSTKPEPERITVTTFILFYLFFSNNTNTPMLGTSSELLLDIAHETPLCIELHVSVSQYCTPVIGLIVSVPNVLLY